MCMRMKIQGKRGYRYSVPLKPPPHRLLNTIRKSAHVLKQKDTMCQALGNATPFSFLPYSYTSVDRERHTIQLKVRLPCWYWSRRRCHICLDQGQGLLDSNTPWWLKGGSVLSIAWAWGGLFCNSLSFTSSCKRRRGRRMGKGRLATSLRWLLLCGLTCNRNKAANY